jgi:glycosyltransferase involved in cell wall biosynthesis
MPELSIIIPSFNEGQYLPSLVKNVYKICVENNLDVEVIISDDASGDETLNTSVKLQEEYSELSMRILHRYAPQRGYGAIVRYGLAHATGRFALIIDASGQVPIHLIPEMLQKARNGAHLVQCSRYASPGDNKGVPRRFRFYQSIYRRLIRIFLGQHLQDSTYGFKLFDRVLMMALGLSSNRFSLSPEITFKIMLSGGKIEFVSGELEERTHDKVKFALYRELDSFAYVLFRACLHRLKILWF